MAGVTAGPFRFCPYCAAPLESRKIPPGEGPERRACPACGYIQWGNSKAASSAILLDNDGRLLLAKRAREPFAGWWDVPGGFLEAGEHPEDGVRREIREETGLEIVVGRLVGVYMDTYGPPPSESTLNFYYVCKLAGGANAEARDDVTEVGWFDTAALPEPIAFDNANAALRDWRLQAGIAADNGV